MKTLLVGEYREGALLECTGELFGFSEAIGSEAAMFLVGDRDQVPAFDGTLYLADVKAYGEYNPEVHKRLLLKVIEEVNPDLVVFIHSSYGWDLAPRIAASLRIAQVSEVIGAVDNGYEVGCCNAKMHRQVIPSTSKAIITIQAGAFPALQPGGTPVVKSVDTDAISTTEFIGFKPSEATAVELAKAEIVVSAGRGVGKKENVEIIRNLAKALGGELGASRPVVDAGWVDHAHQVGSTGHTVAPKLYVACGISGSIQHLAGMKKSAFILAINKDKEAPIGEFADVLVVADVLQFAPALAAKLTS
jgi:electron transfer flavoprotein alpha subunit